MSSQNGLRGGVILGGREMHLTIEKQAFEKLRVLAQDAQRSPHELAVALLNGVIDFNFVQRQRAWLIQQLCWCGTTFRWR